MSTYHFGYKQLDFYGSITPLKIKNFKNLLDKFIILDLYSMITKFQLSTISRYKHLKSLSKAHQKYLFVIDTFGALWKDKLRGIGNLKTSPFVWILELK